MKAAIIRHIIQVLNTCYIAVYRYENEKTVFACNAAHSFYAKMQRYKL